MTIELDPAVARDIQRLVPTFDGRSGDWERVLDQARSSPRPQRLARSRSVAALLSILTVCGAAVIFATPAFGLQRVVTDFFSGAAAPAPVVESFGSLSKGAPAGMDPRVNGEQAREAASYAMSTGETVDLWVAPTASGGLCYQFSRFGGGCDSDHTLAFAPGLMARSLSDGPAAIGGDTLIKQASEIRISFADGTTKTTPVTWVSTPIDAGFFFYEVPNDQWAESSRPTEVSALDESGAVLASHTLADPFTIRSTSGN